MSHTNHDVASRGIEQRDVAIAFLVATWVFVLLRIYVRGYMIRNFGWDDSIMILANLVFTMYCVAILYTEAHGAGTHLSDLAAINKIINWTIAAQAIYIVTICFLKISLGIFFNRIVVKPWQKTLILVVVVVSTVQSVANFFFAIFRCGAPVGDYLTKQIAGQCASRRTNLILLYMHAAVTTITDWIFAGLPVAVVWDAKMDVRTKCSVGFILSLGAFGSICSIVRFFYIDGLTRTDDFFWNATNTAIWSTIEPGVGIIAGSLATMRPLFKSVFTSVRDLTSSASQISKRMSRSFRSPPASGADKSVLDSQKRGSAYLRPDNYSGNDSQHTRTTTTAVSKDGRSTEMKPGFSATQTAASSEYIVTRNEDQDGQWPFDRSVLVTHMSNEEDGIEVDRRSSHTLGEEEGNDVRASFRLPIKGQRRSED
ncbi:uncharacterized protein BDZ99DRAFT_432408 [Mytilinidion resinicola]|uniref:Rhodopsin domain-containing protein n=1 Tax=Mytilinidion resinicola TaxID=574789 RepID=A0A6A6Z4P2_9PEZI|nr:uncharacterized protein BDZ99DRAFT_432408 [Mytilinidion resinicola]KAF2815709.1 hypothetical protein BDZ99DRAFT_432408 [Mytilinidion resinicola]